MDEQTLLKDLNPQQREVVTYGDGPLLVVAGAGSGKTKTLAHRVAYLIAKGVDPERILLLTFTRRAAREMLSRAAQALGQEQALTSRVWGGTFHAIANRLLRMYGRALGLGPDTGPGRRDGFRGAGVPGRHLRILLSVRVPAPARIHDLLFVGARRQPARSGDDGRSGPGVGFAHRAHAQGVGTLDVPPSLQAGEGACSTVA